jgi:1-acyl-sn-glycerol-3-phosphate acyltransferase
LLEAANFAARDVTIRPIAIDYGPAAPNVCWFHEPGMHNVLRILGRRGTVPVTVHVLDPLDRAGDRKQLAHEARQAIVATLGLTSSHQSPIGDDK